MPSSHRPATTGEDGLDAEVTRRLFARRQLLLHGPLDAEHSTRLAAELMTLEADGLDPVTVSINSTGGDLPALFTVTDTMQAMHAPVATRCVGQARGSAVAVVSAGTGRREATPHAQFSLVLPEADVSGTAADVDRAARAHASLTQQLLELIADTTKRSRDHVASVWQDGRVLSAHEALAEGLVDDIAG